MIPRQLQTAKKITTLDQLNGVTGHKEL